MMGRWFDMRYGLLAAPAVFGAAVLWVQDTAPPLPAQPAPVATADKDAAQKGVEVLTRGPSHDALASPDTFFVPGHWVWNGERYAWQAGYWARVQPGYVWVAAHHRWTPSGYVYIPGYWDLAVSRRGVLYAPVVIDPNVVTVGYVYTP